MSRFYNGEEARRKLRCSPRTLLAWAKEAGVTPTEGTDGRERLYSLDQLKQIVRQDSRRRVLLSDAEAFGDESSEETQAAIARYEREVEELSTEIERLHAEIEALKMERSASPTLNVEGLKQELLSLLQREIAAGIEAARQVLEGEYRRRLVELERRAQESVGVKSPQSSPTKVSSPVSVAPRSVQPTTSVTQLSTNQRLIISNIPTNKGERPRSFFEITRTADGLLVAFGEFVELHDIPLSTAKNAKNRPINPLPVVSVNWPKANGHIDWALDRTGQAKLYEFYSMRIGFRRCELCPHTPDKYEHLEEVQKP